MTSTPQRPEPAHGGKVANDHNKAGTHDPTQLNQGHRTPESRGDRESHIGGHNQSQNRRHPSGPAGH